MPSIPEPIHGLPSESLKLGMGHYKIEDFQADHPGVRFPEFQQIEGVRLLDVRRRLAAKLALPAAKTGGLETIKAIEARSNAISNQSADTHGFVLGEVLDDLGVAAAEHVFVDWHRFDEIDRLRLQDLSDYFWDVWYPGPDDIDIFPDDFSWILSVAHDGHLKLLKF